MRANRVDLPLPDRARQCHPFAAADLERQPRKRRPARFIGEMHRLEGDVEAVWQGDGIRLRKDGCGRVQKAG